MLGISFNTVGHKEKSCSRLIMGTCRSVVLKTQTRRNQHSKPTIGYDDFLVWIRYAKKEICASQFDSLVSCVLTIKL